MSEIGNSQSISKITNTLKSLVEYMKIIGKDI